jgi:hypothetical protein
MRTMSALGLCGAAASALCFAAPARAVTLYSSLSAWESAVGGFSETASFGVPDRTEIASFVTPDVNVSVSEFVQSIGPQPDHGWGTWSGGYAGQVLADYASTSVTYSLGGPVGGFGFFAEPDQQAVWNITLTTSDGSVLTQPVAGAAGAAFFGWQGPGVTSFTISSGDDFAVGDIFTAAAGGAPEPAMWALMLVGFAGIGARLRCRSHRNLGMAAA